MPMEKRHSSTGEKPSGNCAANETNPHPDSESAEQGKTGNACRLNQG
jgi:hypothetical protein